MKPALARTFNALTHMLLGALVFWTPDVVVHWIRADRFGNFDVAGLVVLLPVATYLFFRLIWWPRRKPENRFSAALFAVLGIWIAGPSMLTISSSFCAGGGLAQPDAWHFFVFGTLLFPLFTFMMSTFDGSVFAVFLVTLLLPLLANYRPAKSAPPATRAIPDSW